MSRRTGGDGGPGPSPGFVWRRKNEMGASWARPSKRYEFPLSGGSPSERRSPPKDDTRGVSAELERLDRVVGDRPRGELVAGHRVDEVRPALPEADVLHVRP